MFLKDGTGGWFKGKNPNVPVERLRARWVRGATTLYIGKAKNLRQRVWLLVRFGHGEPVAHWGGRLLWQLKDSKNLPLEFLEVELPEKEEKRELNLFERRHGELPFANLRG